MFPKQKRTVNICAGYPWHMGEGRRNNWRGMGGKTTSGRFSHRVRQTVRDLSAKILNRPIFRETCQATKL